MISESGRIKKGSATLIEYAENENSVPDRFFLQSGVVGMYASLEELRDLYSILNYYLNIESFSDFEIRIGGEDVII